MAEPVPARSILLPFPRAEDDADLVRTDLLKQVRRKMAYTEHISLDLVEAVLLALEEIYGGE